MNRENPGHRINPQPTMHDVARLAGVSIKSVSRVINREPHVSAKLRARIDLAIDQLGYVPDLAARSLAGARSFTLGALFDVPSQQYTMKIQAGLYRACVEHQYHLRFEHIDSTVAPAVLEEALARFLRRSRVDAVVLTPPLSDDPVLLDYLDRKGVPYSRIAPFLDPARSAGTRIDDETAAAAIADLLWSHGHRRFATIDATLRVRLAGLAVTGSDIHARNDNLAILRHDLKDSAGTALVLTRTNDDTVALLDLRGTHYSTSGARLMIFM